jgi:para-aminobenzoate synthetase component 1
MWADRLSDASKCELVERLRSVLPAPRANSESLRSELSVSGVPEALWPEEGFIWLDRPGEAWLGADPIARLTVRKGMAIVRGPCGVVEVHARGFDLIEAALEAWRGASGAVLCGYLGYELGSELEGVCHAPLRPSDPPDLHLGLYDWHFEQSGAGWQMCWTNAWRAGENLRAAQTEHRPAAGWQAEAPAPPISSTPSDDGFRAAVARTVGRIFNGELFQVNLCRRLEAALPMSAIWELYQRLRSVSPAEYGALIRTGPNGAVLSVSPELFLSLRNGQVRSCPIKGTRPRGRTAEEDRVLAQELAASEKDRAELAMIVDVTRNDLGRVSAPGSVEVTRHAELMTLPTVHHTVSEVIGRLRPGCGPADLLRASFPPASISGAPKIRAMEVAALEEGFRRGPCMGSIGWISLDGDLELSVAIRTAVAAEGNVWYLAGCGITCESVPEEELAESEAKAAAFRRALEF